MTVGDLTLVKTADNSDPTAGVDYEARDLNYDNFPDVLAIISSTPMTVSGATARMGLATGNTTDAVLTIQNLELVTPPMLLVPALDVGDGQVSGAGSLALTVLGDNLLRSQLAEGIRVPAFMSLTITKESTGKLEAFGWEGLPTAMPVAGSPGIGFTSGPNGPVTIDNGTIVAHGGRGCAGIGGGRRQDGQDITINGGNVTADSMGGGAGIGGGNSQSFARRIAINGGVVRATGGMMAAGIGCGPFGWAEDITITGGEVWAYGGATGGAGIGGGRYADAEGVTITGGFVHAEGADDASYGNGSGIGSGSWGTPQSTNNKVMPLAGFSARFDGISGGGITIVPAPQDYPFDNSDQIAEISFASMPSIDATDLPQGQVGSPYQTALSGSGGVAPYAWSVTAGALPAGLALDASTGVVSGTPTEDGEAVFTVTLTDAWGVATALEKRLLVNVAPVEVLPRGSIALNGRDMEAGEFSFAVRDAAGNTVGTGTSAAARSGQVAAIEFAKMTFAAPGVYAYTVSQEKGSRERVAYDEAMFKMVVTVVKDRGMLTAEVTYPQGEPMFKNTYTAPVPVPTPDPVPETKPVPTSEQDASRILVKTGDEPTALIAALAACALAACAIVASGRFARMR